MSPVVACDMRFVDDSTWAILTIYGEARGESCEGKVAVGEVIRNRAQHHYNCDGTIAGACLAPKQFSAWNGNDPNRMLMARCDSDDAKECIRAWAMVQGGSEMTKGALLYVNLDVVTPWWVERCRQTVKIGHHTFFVPV